MLWWLTDFWCDWLTEWLNVGIITPVTFHPRTWAGEERVSPAVRKVNPLLNDRPSTLFLSRSSKRSTYWCISPIRAKYEDVERPGDWCCIVNITCATSSSLSLSLSLSLSQLAPRLPLLRMCTRKNRTVFQITTRTYTYRVISAITLEISDRVQRKCHPAESRADCDLADAKHAQSHRIPYSTPLIDAFLPKKEACGCFQLTISTDYKHTRMSVWVYECMRVNGVSRISQSSDSPTLQPSYLTHTFNNSLLNTICWWQLQSFSFVAYARIIIIRTQQVIRLLDSLTLLTPHTNNYFVLLQCKGAVSYSTVEESLSLSLSLFSLISVFWYVWYY